MPLGLKFLLWKNRNVSFRNNSIQICIFNRNNCSKKSQYNAIMEKTNRVGKGWGRVKVMAFLGVK